MRWLDCVTELDLHPLRRDVSGRESGDGRGDVDDLPAVRAGGWHSRHRLRPGSRAGGVAGRAAGEPAAQSLAVRRAVAAGADSRFATIGRSAMTPIVDSPRLAQHLGRAADSAQGRRPQSDRLVQGPGQLGRRCSCVASRREDDRLRVDRQRGQQPGRSRGAGGLAGVSSSCRRRRRSRRWRSCRCSARRCSR